MRLRIVGCNSIPIARSINPDDSVDLTRLSSLKKRRVLDGSWRVPDSIGRSVGTHISSPDRNILSALPSERGSVSPRATTREVARHVILSRGDNFLQAEFPLLIAVRRHPDHFAMKLLGSAVNSSAPGGSFPSVI